MKENLIKETADFVKHYSTNGNVLTIDEISTLLKNSILDGQFLTVDELSRVLKVEKSWIYAQTRQTGKDAIPMLKVGKYRRFVLSDVVSWLNRDNTN